MKSESMQRHFNVLEQQRREFLPKFEFMSIDQLWQRPLPNKWSAGESMYHLYLLLRLFRRLAKVVIPTVKPYARIMRHKQFQREINDIYAEYKNTKGKKMNAPWVLNPPTKIRHSMNGEQLNILLNEETQKMVKLVENIEEGVAGHITFFDPIAKHPNLIQGVQLLAIHEMHHFKIMKKYI